MFFYDRKYLNNINEFVFLNGFCLMGRQRDLKENIFNIVTIRCQLYSLYDKRGNEIFYLTTTNL